MDPSFVTYEWSNGQTGNSATIENIGMVSINVTDSNGCEYSDELELTLAPDCYPTYVVPNVFTPNNDDQNDYFFIDATNISEQTITIVNRWNNVMYSSTGPKPIWDGRTSTGAFASDGIYYVMYTLKAENGDIIKGTSFFHLVGK